MAARVFDGIKSCEHGHFLKRTSQGTFQPSLVQIGQVMFRRRRCLKGLLTPNFEMKSTNHLKYSCRLYVNVVLSLLCPCCFIYCVHVVSFTVSMLFHLLCPCCFIYCVHVVSFTVSLLFHVCCLDVTLFCSNLFNVHSKCK